MPRSIKPSLVKRIKSLPTPLRNMILRDAYNLAYRTQARRNARARRAHGRMANIINQAGVFTSRSNSSAPHRTMFPSQMRRYMPHHNFIRHGVKTRRARRDARLGRHPRY